jgi:8-oxo-dGTP pyrophosphatase MutT (NUDIX family)
MLRRRLPLASPLTGLPESLARLARRLASHRPICASETERVWAAVALIVAPDPDSLLLIRRAERVDDPWSGHIGLPGGRRAAADPDLIDTAVRETLEEIGLSLAGAHRLGTLDDVVPRVVSLPPIAVRPFVFATAERPPLVIGPEVTSAHWVPLAQLQRPEIHGPTAVEVRGESLVVPAYVVGDLVVWGMTERILSSFFEATSAQ